MKAIKKPIKVSCWLITQEELDRIWDKKAQGTPGLSSFAYKLHGSTVWIRRERKDDYDKKKGWGKVIARVHTLEGDMTLNAGDYLIRGVAKEYYPCRADIFKKTYKIYEK